MIAAALVVFSALGCALYVVAVPSPPDRADVLRKRMTPSVTESTRRVALTRWPPAVMSNLTRPFFAWRRSRHAAEFRRQLPDALVLLCGALRAGLAVRPALESVAADMAGPVGDEWKQALLESSVGLSLDAALARVAERTGSAEAAWLVELIAINRDVGGDLSDVLHTLAATLRERDRQHRRIRALTAEARLSAIILCVLPPGFSLYLTVVRPDYVAVLLASPAGWAMVAMAVGLLVVGIIWMRLLIASAVKP